MACWLPRVKAEVRGVVQSVDGRVVFANGKGVLRNLEDRGDASSFHGKGELWRRRNECIRWIGRRDFSERVGSGGAGSLARPLRESAWFVCVSLAHGRMLLHILYAIILAFVSPGGLSRFRRRL